jgi:hypothetical protein
LLKESSSTAVPELKETIWASLSLRVTALRSVSLDSCKRLDFPLKKLSDRKKATSSKLFHSTPQERELAVPSDILLKRTQSEFSVRVHLRLLLNTANSSLMRLEMLRN